MKLAYFPQLIVFSWVIVLSNIKSQKIKYTFPFSFLGMKDLVKSLPPPFVPQTLNFCDFNKMSIFKNENLAERKGVNSTKLTSKED